MVVKAITTGFLLPRFEADEDYLKHLPHAESVLNQYPYFAAASPK